MNIERPRRMELEQEQREHVDRGQELMGRFEMHLRDAIGCTPDIVEWLREAYRLRIIEGTQCMTLIALAGVLGGDLSAVEAKVYPVHGDMTKQVKEQGIDMGGPYAALADIKRAGPETRDGGR